MNDRMKESLSALVDGQADELEIRRLLNATEENEELRDSWNRYQMMGALMRDEPVTSIDLSKGIMQAIAGEPMDEVPVASNVSGSDVVHNEESGRSGARRWMASGAVAASVAVAVLLGVRISDDLGASNPVGASVAAVSAQQEVGNTSSSLQEPQSSYVLASSSMDHLDSETSIVVDEETLRDAQQRLQDYVMQHSEQSAGSGAGSLMPYARVTSFGQGEQGQK